jgi:uncharacterized protein with NAD-binding domain and iron-sulfur cluster
MDENRNDPIKVAIVGGGCAAMAAAFELTRPEHRGRYQLTIYQLGWRLGGKGASGRGPAGRIEEHGLHLWMGWYENAFRLMRECYAELGRDPSLCPIADWKDAFDPLPLVGVTDPTPDGGFEPWLGMLPPSAGLPGDSHASPRSWTVRDYMVRTAELLRTLLQSMWAGTASEPSLPAMVAELAASVARDPANLGGAIQRLLQLGEIAGLTGLVQATAVLEMAIGRADAQPGDTLLRLVDEISTRARALLEDRLSRDLATRRVWQVIDLTLATLRGEIRFGILTDPRGFDAIDEYDCREWLLLNGAAQSSVDSGFVRGLYDLGFSYEEGDPARPRISAGQSLRAMVRAFFTYRGAFFWRMRAGMGDVVFAPFYEVLRRRGVKFEFFHRLENVAISGNGSGGGPPHVAALEFDVQANASASDYRPLVNIEGLPCWPSEPDWDQLVDGDQLRREGREFEVHADRRRVASRTLRVGVDFDLVVLAVGLGAVPHVCREIVARDPRWRAMVDHVKTVATQAFQVWLSADMESLGWKHGPVAVSGFVEPFDTWADMRHLLPREAWQGRARAIAYFCSVLPDADVIATGDAATPAAVAAIRDQVRRDAVTFLDRDIGHLWPRAIVDGRFRWDLLVVPGVDERPRSGDAGRDRFRSQFWTANVSPTERYTLSLPGSTAYRISPLDRTYDNLTVAGDWTACGFNAGCVEAAVMSGRLAAHALSLRPSLEEITGYDHP